MIEKKEEEKYRDKAIDITPHKRSISLSTGITTTRVVIFLFLLPYLNKSSLLSLNSTYHLLFEEANDYEYWNCMKIIEA